jgi:cysteine-rich repeat protein
MRKSLVLRGAVLACGLGALFGAPAVAEALSPQCSQPYTELSEADRSKTFNDGDGNVEICDSTTGVIASCPGGGCSTDWAGAGWYRFTGAAGTKMPESPPTEFSCGTDSPGWLDDPHPAPEDGVQLADVCFMSVGVPTPICELHILIEVVNCDGFYLYHLFPLTDKCRRYCGSQPLAVCGNGLVESGEQCDDGNASNGDCCSSSCQYEAAASPCDDGNGCTLTDGCQAGTCVGSNPVVCTAIEPCHVAGSCNVVTGVCSSPNSADGTACEDGAFCTTSDSCTGGICLPGPANDCADADACTADSCDEGMDVCEHAETPRNPDDCFVAPATKFQITDSDTAGKDKLLWQWQKGEAFAQSDLGTPDTAMGTTYTLCVYDNTIGSSSLGASIDVAPSDTLWASKDPKGFQYKEPSGVSEGITKVTLKPGDTSKTKVKLSAGGSGLVLPVATTSTKFFDDSNVVVQLVSSAGECWTSQFTPDDVTKNDGDSFKAQTR